MTDHPFQPINGSTDANVCVVCSLSKLAHYKEAIMTPDPELKKRFEEWLAIEEVLPYRLHHYKECADYLLAELERLYKGPELVIDSLDRKEVAAYEKGVRDMFGLEKDLFQSFLSLVERKTK